MERVPAGILGEMVQRALENVGVRHDAARPGVDGLGWTSLRDSDSHGIRLLPHYIEGVEGGRLNPDSTMGFESTAAATGSLDTDHTFGRAAGVESMKLT